MNTSKQTPTQADPEKSAGNKSVDNDNSSRQHPKTTSRKKTDVKGQSSIVWVVPGVTVGSGGMRTIVNAINELVSRGYACTVLQHCEPQDSAPDPKGALVKSYGLNSSVNVMPSHDYSGSPDCMIATWWATAYFVQRSNAKTKAYFVQDYEPMFYAASEYMLAARRTYSFGFEHIVIGRGLAKKLQDEFNASANSFDFGVDNTVYHPLGSKHERAVCALYQPGKPHRCKALLETSLKILHVQAPDVKIYLYGSNEPSSLSFAEHLGLLDLSQCNDLYNRCAVGLCLSASNPSRIPFEMMAAGLPVVDLYGENTLYDYEDGSILLSDCTPESLAKCMLRLLDDHELADRQAKAGIRFMENRSMKKEVSDIAELIEAVVNEAPRQSSSFGKMYSGPAENSPESLESPFNRYGMLRDETFLVANALEISYETTSEFTEGDSVSVAVWSSPDQSDLIWYTCDQVSTTRATCVVNGADFKYKEGSYQIHLYRNSNGNNHMVAQTNVYLRSTSEDDESCPWGYARAHEAGSVSPSFRISIKPCEPLQQNGHSRTGGRDPKEKKGTRGLFGKIRRR